MQISNREGKQHRYRNCREILCRECIASIVIIIGNEGNTRIFNKNKEIRNKIEVKEVLTQ